MNTIDAGTLRSLPSGAKEFTGFDPAGLAKAPSGGPRPGAFREALDRERSRATLSSASPFAGPASGGAPGARDAAREREGALATDQPLAPAADDAGAAQESNHPRADLAPRRADPADAAPSGTSDPTAQGAAEGVAEGTGTDGEPPVSTTREPESRSDAEPTSRGDASVSDSSAPVSPSFNSTSTTPTTTTSPSASPPPAPPQGADATVPPGRTAAGDSSATEAQPEAVKVPEAGARSAGTGTIPSEAGPRAMTPAPASGDSAPPAAGPVNSEVEGITHETAAADHAEADPTDSAERKRGRGSRLSPELRRREAQSALAPSADQNRVERSQFVLVEDSPSPPAPTPVSRSGAAEAAPAPTVAAAAASAQVVPASLSPDHPEGEGADRRQSRGSGNRTPPTSASATPESSQSAAAHNPGALAPGSQPAAPIGAASTDAAALPTAQLSPDDSQALAQSLSRGLTAALNQRGGVLTLRLAPESLGLIRIQMSLDQGAVSLRLETTNPAAQGLLSQNLAMLRATLESKGLSVEKLSIEYAPTPAHALASTASHSGQGHQSGAFSANADSQPDSGAEDSRRHDAAGDHSRGRRDQNPNDPSDHRAAAGIGSDPDDHSTSSPLLSRFGGRLRLRLETVA